MDESKGFTDLNGHPEKIESDAVTYTVSQINSNSAFESFVKGLLDSSKVNGTVDEVYHKVLWILDHMYVPTGDNETDIYQMKELLKSSGYTQAQADATFNGITEENLNKLKDIIDVAQKIAIWNYTNTETRRSLYVGSKDVVTSNDELNGTNFEQESLQSAFHAISNYLINTANNNSTYTSDESLSYVNKITVWSDGETYNTSSSQPIVIIERTPKIFDLALRKRITATGTKVSNQITYTALGVNDARPLENENIDRTNLNDDNEETTTAEYKHRKSPVEVNDGDYVVYTISVFNEGNIAGRATEITDQLPSGLVFDESETNRMYSSEGYSYSYTESTNTIVISEKTGTIHKNLAAYVKNGTLAKNELHVVCKVDSSKKVQTSNVLTNIAWISADNAPTGMSDIDSQPGTHPTKTDSEMPGYKGTTSETDLSKSDTYYPGEQDDDDFDKITIKEKIFDLALRKRITKINNTPLDVDRAHASDVAQDIRVISIDTKNLDNRTGTQAATAEYKHRKDPITVNTNDLVTYTITIYNEGDIDGSARQIIDQLPSGLEFVEGKTTGYTYNYTSSNNQVTITEQTEHNLSAYVKGSKQLSQTDIELVCRVKEEKGDNEKILTNVAWISKEYNKEANLEIENQTYSANKSADRDSEPVNHPEVTASGLNTIDIGYKGTTSETDLSKSGTYYPGQQDDDDFDKIKLPAKDKVFDLALRKYITEIRTTDDNGNAVINTIKRGTIKDVDIDKSTINTVHTATYKHSKEPLTVKTGDQVVYNITVYNEGEVEGKAIEIIDQLPTGLSFNKTATDALTANNGYTIVGIEGNKVKIIDNKANNIGNLDPFDNTEDEPDSRTVKVVCNVTEQASDKEIILTNIAYISKQYNAEADLVVTNQRYIDNKKADYDSQPVTSPSEDADDLRTEGVIGYTGNGNKADLTDKTNYYKGQQDDDDFEKVRIAPLTYDFALRKFITAVNDKELVDENGNYLRAPVVDTSTITGPSTTARYVHTKEPISVQVGNIVTYTIRVYNEGGLDGYISEITDHLPEYLEFLPNDELNIAFGWVYDEEDTTNRTIKTDVTSSAKSDTYKTKTGINRNNTLLTAFDGGNTLDYIDVQIRCRVKTTPSGTKVTNIAEITGMEDKNKNSITSDIDSQTTGNGKVKLPSDSDLPGYKDSELNKDYIPGQQDDDDFEKVLVQIFDLSLRKFITGVNDTEITNRYPVPTAGEADADGKIKKDIIYTHTKEPVEVANSDLVTYTIRVYNEGEISGYAKEVTDNLPEGLEFLPEDETNIEYRWVMHDEEGNVVTDVSKAKYITTDYLSKEQSGINGLINAFDKDAGISSTNPDHKDLKVVFKVTEPNSSDRILINTAQISDDSDKDGNEIDDKDSIPHTDEEYDFDDNRNNEDDIDYDQVKLKYFDLALRKFITAVNGSAITNRYPVATAGAADADGKIKKDIIYTHTKEPVEVSNGNLVTYTIRVYNEGQLDGYAKVVTDNLPEGLEYVFDNKINEKYLWKLLDENENVTTDLSKAKYITTDYLSKEQGEAAGRDNLIKAFDKTKAIADGNPDYRDLEIVFKVTEPNTSKRILINTAQITEDEDRDGNTVDDKDSIPSKTEEYNFDDDRENEDDIDIEKVKLKYFDLALRKFITAVDNTNINNRYPELSINDEGNIVYTHTKVPVDVENGNIVTYTIRVYNEGNQSGYADEVTDDMPEGLEFLPNNAVNTEYRWQMIDKDGKVTTDVTKAVKITTDYLSKSQEDLTGRKNLIKAFDSEKGLTAENPDYKDLKVAFKVIEPNTSDRILVNTAEISKDLDESGSEVEDIDSIPGNGKLTEDDIDKEYVKVKYFDLALKKWVSQAIVIDGKEQTVINSGHTGDENPEPALKVDLKEKKINSVTVKFVYQIKVINEGEIAGYAKEVKDHIPAGLEFIQEDNPDWYVTGDREVATAKLENTLLQPGETATVSIILEWINDSENMGRKTNFAEISKDYNESGTPDIDSKTNNFKDTPKEDDEDEAPVLLAVQTGAVASYIGLGVVVIVILGTGVILIKKYVL